MVFSWAGYHGSPLVNIWRIDADGHDSKQLTNERYEMNPLCSPDGKWVYFRTLFGHDIVRVSIGGGNTEIVRGTRIPGAQLDTSPISISPDGVWLAFLIHVEPTGDETAHQTKVVLLNLELAGKSADAATIVKRIVSPDQRISGGPQFTLDGKAIVYPIREAGVDNLWLQPIAPDAPDDKARGKSTGCRTWCC